jgi:hypothetical protein
LGVGASRLAAGTTTNSEKLVPAPFFKEANTLSEGWLLLGVDAGRFIAGITTNLGNLVLAPFFKGAGTSPEGQLFLGDSQQERQ